MKSRDRDLSLWLCLQQMQQRYHEHEYLPEQLYHPGRFRHLARLGGLSLNQQMFYATGSIYEDPNMGSWGQGSPPQNSAPPPASDPGGDDGGEGGQSGSESLSASTSQTDSATLTSTPATHPTSVSGTAITSTLSSAAPTGNTTSGFGKDLDGQKGGGSGHAMQTAWLAIAAGIFAAWFSDQGVGEL